MMLTPRIEIEQLRSQQWWRRRQSEILRYVDKNDAEIIGWMRTAYEEQYQEIDKQLFEFYGRYATDNKITRQEAEKRLRGVELEYYRDSVRDFREYLSSRPADDVMRQQMQEMIDRYAQASKVQRLDMLMLDIDKELAKMSSELGERLDNHYQDIAYHSYGQAMGGLGVSSTLNRPALQGIVSSPTGSRYGRHFSVAIWGNRDNLSYDLRSTFIRGFVQGSGVREMASEMRKKYNVRRAQAEAIIRTEGNNVINSATLNRYVDAGLKHARINVHIDDRTSVICRAHHEENKLYTIGKETDGVLPAHVNCRSGWIPDQDELLEEHWTDGLDDIDPLDDDELGWADRIKKKMAKILEDGTEWHLDDVKKAGRLAREEELGDILKADAKTAREYKEAEAKYKAAQALENRLNAEFRARRGPSTDEQIKALNEASRARYEAAMELIELRDKRSKISYGEELGQIISKIRDIGGTATNLAPRSFGAGVDRVNASLQYLPTEWADKLNAQMMVIRQKKGRSYFQNGYLPIELYAKDLNSKSSIQDYADVYGSLYLDAEGDEGTALHELMHYLESRDDNIGRLQDDFFVARTKDEEAQRLRDIFNNDGYRADEIAKPDDFVNAYMGKIYRDPNHYELLTMGVEYLYTKPGDLASDEDYLDFIMGLLLTQ